MKVRRSFSRGGDQKATGAPQAKKVKKKAAANPRSLRQKTIIGGGILAASLVVGYLFAALIVFPAPFIIKRTRVPLVTQMTVERAQNELTGAGFLGEVAATETHSAVPRGQVIWQDPPPGVAYPQGSAVSLTVSNGPARIPIPGVSGYDTDLAIAMIESRGLIVGSITRTQTTAPPGVVMNTRPTEGQFVEPGFSVTLVVSEGAPTINVPMLLGLQLDSARVELENSNLLLGTHFFRTRPQEEPGSIIEQTPAAGTLSAPGTPVNVVLARERRPDQ